MVTGPDFGPDKAKEGFPRHFTEFGVSTARRARHILGRAAERAVADPRSIRTAVDFGAGFGEPTWVVREWVGEDARLTAVEQKPELAARIAETQPETEVVTGDGIEYLRQLALRGRGVDLITAFALGPDSTGTLSRGLIAASQAGLAEKGLLILNATDRTAQAALGNCRELGLSYTHLEPEMLTGSNSTHHTLLVPKQ